MSYVLTQKTYQKRKKELFLKTPKERSQITVVEVKKSAYGEALCRQ